MPWWEPGDSLRTGMFANLDVVLPDGRSVLPVPVTAIAGMSRSATSVFVVEAEERAVGVTERVHRQQFVRLGQARAVTLST